ncbi:putative bifunctional diguanylate cyclase/phosphodiesterase [Deinococcus ruber]|uniref:Uncharacterized protein n=1 Tax=Deinococcus ruber TaxID=1848197 RepID=A0A918CAT3_9DEIO|nr:GGDEF and EAL domain-containing protein [Deinococcus ruber]GGR13267.1 hypothetical protein GCM10008957_27780 [Deinococcus ruber]
MPDDELPSHYERLRRQAEHQLRRGVQPRLHDAAVAEDLSYELQVYRVELDLQQETLQLTATELEVEREHYQALYEHAPVAYFSLDPQGEIVDVNLAGLKLLQFQRRQLLLRRFSQFIVPPQRGAFAALLHEGSSASPHLFTVTRWNGEQVEVQLQVFTLPGITPERTQCLLTLTDITPLVQAQAQLAQLNVTLEDRVTEGTRHLRELNVRLHHQALHDYLTGLPNRAGFAEELQRALVYLRQDQQAFAVLFCDIDRFKAINDALGHSGGDEVLIELSRRLQAVTRPTDQIARLGGDEFAMLLHDVTDLPMVSAVIARLEAAVQAPCSVAGHELYLNLSTGVLLVNEGYEQPEEIMRDVDLALYQAKQAGRAMSRVFQPAMRDVSKDRLGLEAQLHHVLEREELVVHYQPVVSLATRQVVGLEALVRWQHPQRGLLLPEAFIPLAEEHHLVGAIDRWVLQEVGRQVARWQRQRRGTQKLWMNVNVSAQDLTQVAAVTAHLRALAFPAPWQVMVELTERVLMHRTDADPSALEGLRQAQVQLVVDDFGMGFSSLSRLHRLPVSVLKVDRSFVAALEEDIELVRAMVSMGRALGMVMVAEGIETEAQYHRLVEIGVEAGQGWLFAPALPADQVNAYLPHSRKRRRSIDRP